MYASSAAKLAASGGLRDSSNPRSLDRGVSSVELDGGGNLKAAETIVALKKKGIQLDTQLESVESMNELLKHQNDTLKSELNYFRKSGDRSEELQRELLLRESEDKRFALSQQLKTLSKQYGKTINNLIDEK